MSSDLAARVAEIQWWHRIRLAHGVTTPGQDRTDQKLQTLHLPRRLDGLSVLDIGAADGFFSFEAERRGAARVLAIDHPRWTLPYEQQWSKRGFDLAHEALGSRVESRVLSLDDLTVDDPGPFDLVLFLGVLYHVKDPMGSLARVASVTRKMAVIETMTDMNWTRRPAAAFYADMDERPGNDTSNWWGLNDAAVVGMLRVAGFRRVRRVYARPLHERIARAVYHRVRHGIPLLPSLQQGRAVFHAWK